MVESREIKFRVYNRREKKFLIQDADHRLDYALNYFELTTHVEYPQQYIGLLDKNKKEIYEGDIITDNYGRNWEVFWHNKNAGFCYKEIRPKERQFDGKIGPIVTRCQEYLMAMCEVIGNIYETPQLLVENATVSGEE